MVGKVCFLEARRAAAVVFGSIRADRAEPPTNPS
jgi:hypothetical protein